MDSPEKSDSDLEADISASSRPSTTVSLKLDPHGYPLDPQPSDDPLDPLNWRPSLKLPVLLQVSLLGLINFTSQATQNPAYPLIASAYSVSVTQASWTSTIPILAAAVAPLAWAPLSNVYGRRVVYVYVTVVGIVALVGSAVASSWGGLLAARFFVGVGTSTGIGIGGSVVADLYCQHERGFYMGIYVLLAQNGAHIAALIGGPVGQYLGFRWCFWMGAILLGAIWVVILFGFPETLYRREEVSGRSLAEWQTSKWSLFGLLGVPQRRKLKLRDFMSCFIMLKYPPVYLAGIYFSLALGMGSVLFAVMGAAAFGGIYGFDILQIGLAIGVPPLTGALLAELLGGRVSDYMLLRYRQRTGHVVEESRLYGTIPGAILLPAGVIIEGVTLQYRTHWVGPCIGMGIASFGFQIASANIFGYLTDCYRAQAAEISSVLNFGRLLFAFTLGFYMVPFAERTEWGTAFSVMAMIHFATYSGVVLLMWKGQQWREYFGPPNLNQD